MQLQLACTYMYAVDVKVLLLHILLLLYMVPTVSVHLTVVVSLYTVAVDGTVLVHCTVACTLLL